MRPKNSSTPLKILSFAHATTVFALSLSAAYAAGTGSSTGTGAPPTQLGPYTLTSFPVGYDDPRTGVVTEVPTPLGGSLIFSEGMEILEAGSAFWSGWSHGFAGDVYAIADFNRPGPFAITLTLPSDTGAFLFYGQPSPFVLLEMTATLDDGTTLSQDVHGDTTEVDGGAKGFGFWAPLGGSLASITVTSEFDFALAEFGIARAFPNVPEAGNWMAGIAALGLLGFSVIRRRAHA